MKAILITLFIYSFLFIQTQQQRDDVDRTTEIARIGSETITLGELIDNFKINQTEEQISRDELVEFLPSYIEYRLKLKKGFKYEFNKKPDLLEEFELYGRQAAEIYWMENEIKQQMIEAFIERSNYELYAFHILIEVPNQATVDQEKEIMNRILQARKDLVNGIDPNEVNATYSSVRNGNYMGGQLPWITAGRTVEPFEDALFSLEVGEISEPVRTAFGYHIIYLQNKRERSPDRQVSHIFFQDTEESLASEKAADVHQKLTDGLFWYDAVETYSMDRNTIANGGLIGWVGYAMQFPEPFVDAVMAKNPSEPFSEPIEMPYGVHIVRIDSVRNYPSEEARMEEIVRELERLQRLNPSEDELIEALKSEGNFTLNQTIIDSINSADPNSVIISFNEKEYTVNDFSLFSEVNDSDSDELLDDFIQEVVLSHLIDITRSKFPDFDAQISSFLNGLVVFRINEEFIWSEDAPERSALEQFYAENKENYWFDRTFTYFSVSAFEDSIITKAVDFVENGVHPKDLSEHIEEINVRRFSTSNSNNPGFDLIENIDPGTITEIQISGVRHSFFFLNSVEEPRQMTFDEAFSRVVNDYMPIQEAAFINLLKSEFGVETFPENIQI
ncbi:MAG: hypothetical protein EA391_13570 [Balneolaceae bacterium]|nr:MAG: hypothetical protein EA391_13570 [Balneolaceae bacterium]